MKNAIIIYPTFSKRYTIHLNTDWSLISLVHNLLCIAGRTHFGTVKEITVYQKSLPGNRFLYIQKLNEKLLYLTIRILLKPVLPLHTVWINTPYLYAIHNTITPDFLVFACDKNILKDPHTSFLYKEYFLAGWIFVYHLQTPPTVTVFKRTPEHAILKAISHMNT